MKLREIRTRNSECRWASQSSQPEVVAQTFLSAVAQAFQPALRRAYPSGLISRTRNADRNICATYFAFTLIEVVISAAIMSLVLVSGYLCLSAALSTQKIIEPRAEIFQNARVAMALMSADLRAACPLSKDDAFLGLHRMVGQMPADNLDFATHNYTPRHDREGDFCQTSFFLDKDLPTGQWVLWRRRNPRIGLDPLSGGSREEIARGVLGLQFEYSDGLDWYESWGQVDRKTRAQATSLRERSNLDGLPQAVRITLWLDSNPRAKAPKEPDAKKSPEPPLVFQTVARLNLASSDSVGSGGGSDADSSGQPAGGSGNQGGGQ